MSGPKTINVRAEVPVLGMRRGAVAELADSDYLRAVLAQGWLTHVRKTDGTDPQPLSDAATVSPAELEHDAAAAADAIAAAQS